MNVAEILKNCPKGTKLYSPIFGEVKFEFISPDGWIKCYCNSTQLGMFYPDGTYSKNGEVMLFPSKEQRDWSKFLIPFEDGDVIVSVGQTSKFPYENMAIFEKYNNRTDNNKMTIHCQFTANNEFNNFKQNVEADSWRKATEEERKEFFESLCKEGYVWTGKELIKKFEPGNYITNGNVIIKVYAVTENFYLGRDISSGKEWSFPLHRMKDWKLAKFNLESLRPYDKVLVKSEEGAWYPSLVSYVASSGNVYLIDTNNKEDYVIPFEGNEYLIGKWDDPDPYYITWK